MAILVHTIADFALVDAILKSSAVKGVSVIPHAIDHLLQIVALVPCGIEPHPQVIVFYPFSIGCSTVTA